MFSDLNPALQLMLKITGLSCPLVCIILYSIFNVIFFNFNIVFEYFSWCYSRKDYAAVYYNVFFLKYLSFSLEIFKSFFLIYFFIWGFFLDSRFSAQLSQNKALDLTSQRGVLSHFSVMLWALMERGGSSQCTWLLASSWAGPHLFP